MIKKSEHQTQLPFIYVIIESQRYEQREAETRRKGQGFFSFWVASGSTEFGNEGARLSCLLVRFLSF